MPKTNQIKFREAFVQTKVRRVSREVASWLRKKHLRTINLVSILEGARPFTRDLLANLRKLAPQTTIHLLEIAVKSTDGIKLLKTRKFKKSQLKAKTLRQFPTLIVDDIVDSGLTLKAVRKALLAGGAPEVKTAIFLKKFASYRGTLDFCAIHLNLNHKSMARKGVKDYWLYGYGMDLNGKYRGLKKVGWIEIKK